MKRKYFILLMILTLALAGCWNRRELDTLSIVSAIAIDKSEEEGKLSVAFQIIQPSRIKGSSPTGGTEAEGTKGVWVLTSTGHTIFDAARNATAQSDRRLFFPQNKVIVIGEELAREGIAPLLDFFHRDPEPRRMSWLLIAKGNAHDIISAKHEQENIPARAIDSIIKSSSATSMAVKVNLNDFLKNLTSPASDPIACRIEMIQDHQSKNQGIRFTGAAVFKKDKLVGFLDQYETRGLNWILGKVVSGITLIKSPINESKYLAIEIIRATSRIIPEIQDGKVKITVEVTEEGNLAEQFSDVDLSNTEMFKELEKRKAQVIKSEIQSVLKKGLQEWRVDIFGFGKAVHRRYPKEWKTLQAKWRDMLPEIDVEVKVDAIVRDSGISTLPAKGR